jgi:hypothetical protein
MIQSSDDSGDAGRSGTSVGSSSGEDDSCRDQGEYIASLIFVHAKVAKFSYIA